MVALGQGRLIGGRYRLEAVIGRGGMGIVWQARDELLGRDVAVKELVWPTDLSAAEKRAACRRATREARVAARLNHRSVIRIFDIVQEDGCPWIVMEHLPYGSLRDLVRERGLLSPAQAAEVGLGILAALRAAHAEGIVHRDVKPANILIAPDRVVLTDFGIARAITPSETTTIGGLVGSPSYIAPERARGGQAGPAEDLWGLGASLYAAVEGRGPFDREGGAMASLLAVVADEPAPAVHAGPLLWPVINGLLCKDPAKRLDAAQAERMLRRVVAPPPAHTVTPSARRPHRRVGVLAGSAVLAVVAASGTTIGLALANSPSPWQATSATSPPPAGNAYIPPATTHPRMPAKKQLTSHTPQSPVAPSSSAPAVTTARTGSTGKNDSPWDGLAVQGKHSPHAHGRGHHKSHH
jgi:eukaryotic-like serine/threonine-protein kinase